MRNEISSDTLSNDLAGLTGNDELFDAERLGRFLGYGTSKPGSARASINMRIHRGHPMPPYIVIPGLSGRRWLRPSVVNWLKTYEKSDVGKSVDANMPASAPVPTLVVPRRRRGRPTKAESMARRRVPSSAPDSSPRIKKQ